MEQFERELENLGRNIQDIVDRAVNSQDYQKLNQTVTQAVDKAGEAVRKAVNVVSHTPQGARYTSNVPVKKKNLPVLYGKTNGKTAGCILKIIGGSILGAFFGLALLGVALTNELFGTTVVPSVVFCLVGLSGGAGLLGSGIFGLEKVRRFKAYRRVLGDKTHCALEKLARSVGKSVKFVRRDVQKMIRQNLFRQGHLDKEETCLITSDETYRLFEQSRLQLEERKKLEAAEAAEAARQPKPVRDPQVQEVLDKGNGFLAQIRKCNDDIPGVEISNKIDRMEQIVRRIFRQAELHPEVISDLKKLMEYYLPMTVKLLNAYAEMDAQPLQGENILSSKGEIEATLDTLNRAYEKLLDELFEDMALDVSSDISVLNTLLAQEGLTEDGLKKS